MELSALLDGLARPFLDPASRTWWGALAVTALIAMIWRARLPSGPLFAELRRLVRHPSVQLDVQLLLGRQLLMLLRGAGGVAGAWWLATHAVRQLDGLLGVPPAPEWSGATIALAYSVTLFIAWDLSRFLLHLLMHRVPALWALHQVHHSAEVLTPLTFHRIHPLESLLYQARGAVSTGCVAALFFWVFRAEAQPLTLLGVPAAGLLLNAATGNLRHSHVFLRFPGAVERWLLSPAQHQVHHSAEAIHHDSNFGTWLAVWDRIAGTLIIAERPPERFGLSVRNHGDSLLSAWFGPLRGLVAPLAVGAALLIAAPAQAQDTDDDEPSSEEDEDEGSPGLEIIVYDDDGTIRAAGSAHSLDEEDLERFEYDNIERQLAGVPSVNVRSEDGYGLRPNIGIRGANSDRSAKISLMEDGVLLAPAPYAAPAAYYFPMTTRMVGIEVFKGAASVRHGPNTVGGAVNLLTREIPDEGPEGAVDLAAGLRATLKAHAWAGLGDGERGLLVEGVHLQSSGFKELDTGGPTGFRRSELMAKGMLAPSSVNRVELKLGVASELSNETYTGLSAKDIESTPYRRYAATELAEMAWTRTQAELSWRFSPRDSLVVRTVASHHYMDRSWTKLNAFVDGPELHDLLQASPESGQAAVYLAILRGDEDSATSDQDLLIGTNDRSFHSASVQSVARWSRPGEKVSSTLEAGVRVHADYVQRLHTAAPYSMVSGRLVATGGDMQVDQDSVATAQAVAAHVHEELRIQELWLIPGLRTEIVQTEKHDAQDPAGARQLRATLLPGLGVLGNLSPWLQGFAGVHRGFSPVAPGQPEEVDPEVSWNYEAGLRFDQNELRVEGVGFFNDYSNLTGQCSLSAGCDGGDVDRQFNGGEVFIFGAEAVASQTFFSQAPVRVPVDASYTFTRSRFQTAFSSDFAQFGSVAIGDSLPYVPEHQGSLQLALEHDRAALAVGATGHLGMLDVAGTFPVTETDIPSLLLLDASLTVDVRPRVSLYTTGTNLTGTVANTSWRPQGARPSAPRQFMLGVKVR